MKGSSEAERSARGSIATVACLVLAMALGLLADTSRPVSAVDRHFSLYVTTAGGWADTPGGEDGGSGPGLAVVKDDNVTIDLTSEDGLLHGLFIDYNDNRLADGDDYISNTTTSSITFSFVPKTVGQFQYCDQLVPLNCGTWTTRGAPMVTILAPGAGTSWTGGFAHDIVFNVSDPDGDSVDVVLSYTYNGGTQGGTIAGPFPAGTNPNTYPWTPIRFHAPDAIIHLVARDSFGLETAADSPAFEVDSTVPTIASTTPARGARSVDQGTAILVAWSEDMNPVSGAPNAFAVRVQGGPWVGGTVTWSTDMREMTFTPASPLGPGTTYQVYVNETARDSSDPGNAFGGPDTWTFTTGSGSDPNRPTILGVSVDPSQQFPDAPVNLTVDVQDDVGVSRVNAAITGPSFDENVTMAHLGGTKWYVNRTFAAVGPYSATVWASDQAGNFVSQTIEFAISSAGPSGILAPASVTATTSEGVVEVTWTAVPSPGLAGYHVYRGESESGPFVRLTKTALGPTAPTVYRDQPPTGRTYYYTVTAVNASGAESPYAPRFAVTIPPYQPSPLLDPVPWAIAGVTLALILGVLYGTVWRRKFA